MTVVFWENEPQFGIVTTDTSQEAAIRLEDRLNELLAEVKSVHGDDWDCGDLRQAVTAAGLETTDNIPVDGDFWRYDAVG